MNAVLLPQPAERVPFKVIVISMAGVWLGYFLLTSVRGAIIGLEMQGELLWRRGLVSLAGLLITGVMWLILRAFDTRTLSVKIAAALLVALPASLMVAQVNQWLLGAIE